MAKGKKMDKGKSNGNKPGPKPHSGPKPPIAVKLSSIEMQSGKLFWPCSDKSSSGGKTWRLMFAGKAIIMEREWNKRDVPEALRFQGVVEVKHQLVCKFDEIIDLFFDEAGGGGFIQLEIGSELMVKKGVRKSGLSKVGISKVGPGGMSKTEWSKEETPFSSFGGERLLTFRTKKGGSAYGFRNAINKMFELNPQLQALALARQTPLVLKDAWAQIEMRDQEIPAVAISSTVAVRSGASVPAAAASTVPQAVESGVDKRPRDTVDGLDVPDLWSNGDSDPKRARQNPGVDADSTSAEARALLALSSATPNFDLANKHNFA